MMKLIVFFLILRIIKALDLINRHEENSGDLVNFKSLILSSGRLSLENSGNTAAFIADKIIERNSFIPTEKIKIRKQFDLQRIKYELLAYLSSLIGKNERKVFLNKFPNTSADEIRNIIKHICKYKGYKVEPDVDSINSQLFKSIQIK